MEENNKALYRRYRSMSFDELIGQEHITKLLKAAVDKGSFSHAYLFTGQRGTGKTSAARILAHAINDLPYNSDDPNLDIIEIDAASNRRIDDIRDLREKVHIAPVAAKYKVYIIDEVHMLTGESFNALLKTIEEPPEHAVFILATTDLHKVPATIISRTQRFHFRPVAPRIVAEHLATIAKKEKIDIEPEALNLIAEHGGGSFRDSISLLDQLASLEGTITSDTVESVLGRVRSTAIDELIAAVEQRDELTTHRLLNDLFDQGASPVTLAEQIVANLLSSETNSSLKYNLAEKLMTIPKAHFPQLLLTSTLLGFTVSQADQTDQVAPKQEPVAQPKPAPVSQPEKPTSEKPASQPVVEEKEVKEEQAETTDSTTAPTDSAEFDWNHLLTIIKKTNPSLHSVLIKAEHQLDGDKLSLTFPYALHRKKMERPQYKTELAQAISDIYNFSPNIEVIDSKAPAADETAKKVAEIMGGGEAVSV